MSTFSDILIPFAADGQRYRIGNLKEVHCVTKTEIIPAFMPSVRGLGLKDPIWLLTNTEGKNLRHLKVASMYSPIILASLSGMIAASNLFIPGPGLRITRIISSGFEMLC